MALTAICDHCGTGEAVSADGLVPDGWWTITRPKMPNATTKPRLLCSVGCIRAWATSEEEEGQRRRARRLAQA